MRINEDPKTSNSGADPLLPMGSGERTWRDQTGPLGHIRQSASQLKRLADLKYGWRSEIVQFYLVGASGMMVDLSSFAALLGLGIALPLARALSIVLALTWNFAFNRKLTFSSRRFDHSIVKQYLRWVVSIGLGAAISWSVSVALSLTTYFFAQRVFIAALIGIAFGSVTNFVLARHWVFIARR